QMARAAQYWRFPKDSSPGATQTCQRSSHFSSSVGPERYDAAVAPSPRRGIKNGAKQSGSFSSNEIVESRMIRSVCPIARYFSVVVIAVAGQIKADEPSGERPAFRPPAVPLVTCNPYLSIWSMADRLTDEDTRHWTRREHPLTSLIRIDGTAYRLMGSR